MSGIKNACSAQELSELATALERFELTRPHLPQAYRDVNAFRDAAEIVAATNGASASGQRALRAGEKAKALEGTDIVSDLGGWKLIRLRSRAAAQWWGKGTRWCTSSRTSDHFNAYAARGPLLVLLTPFGRYQLFVPTNEFKDAADKDASLARVLKSAPAQMRQAVYDCLGNHP